jgi:tetratricopeptide (TPR) repeat protein
MQPSSECRDSQTDLCSLPAINQNMRVNLFRRVSHVRSKFARKQIVIFILGSFVISSVHAFNEITLRLSDTSSGSSIQDALVTLKFSSPDELVSMTYRDGDSRYHAPMEDRFVGRDATIAIAFRTKTFEKMHEDKPAYVLDPEAPKVIHISRDLNSYELVAYPYPDYYSDDQIRRARELLRKRHYEEALRHIDLALEATRKVLTYQLKGEVLQRILRANPSPDAIAKAEDFVDSMNYEEWGNPNGGDRFIVLYQIGLSVAETPTRTESVDRIAIKALDLARSIYPDDARPCQSKYHILAARETRQGYEEAAQVVCSFFQRNSSYGNQKTASALINDWLAFVEGAAWGRPMSQVPTFNELAKVFRQYDSILRTNLEKKRYNFATSVLYQQQSRRRAK